MKRILILLLLFSAFPMTISAQNDNFWERLNTPSGGKMEIVCTNDGTLYGQKSKGAPLYRSEDNGLNWARVSMQFNGEAVEGGGATVGPSGRFYVVNQSLPGGFQLYVSENQGQDWEIKNDSLPAADIFETSSGALLQNLYSVTFVNHIIRSDDGGVTWTLVQGENLSGTPSFDAMPNGGLILWLNGSPKYYSLDDGQSWHPTNAPVKSAFYISSNGTMLSAGGGKIYRSIDNALTWTLVSSNTYIDDFNMLPSGRIVGLGHPYAEDDSFEADYYSDDDGLSWHTQLSERNIDSYALNALPDGTLLGFSVWDLYRSTDGGISWSLSSYGYDYALVEEFNIISDDTIYAKTNNGLWKTVDGTNTWELIYDDFLWHNKFAADNKGLLFIAAEGSHKLLRSEDWGVSFTDISPDTLYGKSLISICPGDSLLLTNGGYGIYRSRNRGDTWTLVTDAFHPVSFDFHPSGRYYAVDYNYRLYYSDDFGQNWNFIPSLPPPNLFQLYSIYIAQNGIIIGYGFSSEFSKYCRIISGDNGVTWTFHKLSGGLAPKEGIGAEDILGNIYGWTWDGSPLLSVNQGITWQTIPYNDEAIRSLAVTPDQYLIVGSDRGLYRSFKPVTSGAYIRGEILSDADKDCSTDDAQEALRNWNVKAVGNYQYVTTTDSSGRYTMFVDTGSYEISPRIPQQLWWGLCDSSQSVTITQPLGTDTVNFTALALGECPIMTVNVAAPLLRRCFSNPVYVQYCNEGIETATDAWVDIYLDADLSFVSSAQTNTDLGNNTIRFFVGNVAYGQCDQFQLTVYVNCDSTILGQTHCITAHGFPDTLCTTVPNWSGANIEATVSCQDTIVQFQLHNTGPAQSQLLDYIIIEDDVVMFQGQHQYGPGGSISIPLPANGHTLRIESEQEPGHPFSTRALAFEEGCGGFETLGFINQFSVNGITPSWHRICLENIGAYDPNDKQGFPLGTGPEHKIRPGQPIEYMIRFQNTGTDTAFTVVLRDTLSAWLDPASVVPGASSHPYTWQLSGQGELSFSFANILLPDSTTNLAGSQGFVTFSIAQQPEVPLGTAIHNEAAIYFDFNAPVITNKTLHTVGVDLISSTVEQPVKKKASAVQVSPNPAGEFVTFRFTKGDFKGHRLQLFDPLGKAVFETKITGNQYVLPRGQFTSGAYGWRVTDVRGRVTDSGIVIFK